MADDDDTPETSVEAAGGSLRLDKWLWFARVVRTRTLAAGLITDGRVRINRERTLKASQPVRRGDVITVAVGPRVRVLEVTGFGERRGSATDAQSLFRELTETQPSAPREAPGGERASGSGRPTKRDRRALDRLRRDDG